MLNSHVQVKYDTLVGTMLFWVVLVNNSNTFNRIKWIVIPFTYIPIRISHVLTRPQKVGSLLTSHYM